MPSTLGLVSFVAAAGLAGAGAAEARTLRVSALRVETAQATVRNLQLVVTDYTGAEDGPFNLGPAKACPKVPNVVPTPKVKSKPKPKPKKKTPSKRHA